MYNATRLFYQPQPQPSLKTQLVLTDLQKDKLRACRKLIRDALRDGLAKAGSYLPREQYYTGRFLETASLADQRDWVLRPKFRTQGSWAYDTLNRPAKACQQIDLDEGMYVPMSLVEGAQPAVASSALYQIVELILGQLCKTYGWTLDTSKSICIRVLVDAECHIDLNIYAVPDAQLALVEKSMAAAFADSQGMVFDSATPQILRLDSDQVYVAHRRKGWEQSDPMQLEDWFNDAVKRHKTWTDLRRIVRYLKAWRDERWEACALNSLSLMVCAVEALDEANTPPLPGRDDDGLLVVARALSAKLASQIHNPVVSASRLNGEWSVADRNQFELAARTLSSEMEAALKQETSSAGVVRRIRKLFGGRVPDDVTLVSAAPLLDQVRSTPAKQMASPKVGTSTSG
jgi:hypothetical protein